MKKIIAIVLVLVIAVGTCVPAYAGTKSLPFNDVTKTRWSYDYIIKCYDSGLMNGVAKNVFDPEGRVTRAQLITILYRLDTKLNDNHIASVERYPFSDVSNNDWHASAVYWGVKADVTSGMSPTTFGPQYPITRQDAITMIYRYMKYLGQDMISKNNLYQYIDKQHVSSYATAALNWAISIGMISSMSSDKLECAPLDYFTREQCSKICVTAVEFATQITRWNGINIADIAYTEWQVNTVEDCGLKYRDWYNTTEQPISYNYWKWCAAFVSWCIDKSGEFKPGGIYNGICSAAHNVGTLCNDAAEQGCYVTKKDNENYIPQPGDLCICGYGREHVQMVLFTDNNGIVHYIGGNEGLSYAKNGTLVKSTHEIWRWYGASDGCVVAYITPKK